MRPLHRRRTNSSQASFATRNCRPFACFFFFTDTATTEIYTLSLHDALPILVLERELDCRPCSATSAGVMSARQRSEEHTSELQSRRDLVCRLLLEKKK